MTSQNSQNPKQDTLPSKYTGTVLSQSQIQSLRQDLKEAVAYAQTKVKQRQLPWLKNNQDDNND